MHICFSLLQYNFLLWCFLFRILFFQFRYEIYLLYCVIIRSINSFKTMTNPSYSLHILHGYFTGQYRQLSCSDVPYVTIANSRFNNLNLLTSVRFIVLTSFHQHFGSDVTLLRPLRSANHAHANTGSAKIRLRRTHRTSVSLT